MLVCRRVITIEAQSAVKDATTPMQAASVALHSLTADCASIVGLRRHVSLKLILITAFSFKNDVTLTGFPIF